MADVPVNCVKYGTGTSPDAHQRITHIGNSTAKWMWPVQEVIRSIETNTNTFYVWDDTTQKRAYIGVVRPSDGRDPWIQSHADGRWTNNLLTLPHCS